MHKLVISEKWAERSDSTGVPAERREFVAGLRAVAKEPVSIYRMSCGYGDSFYEIVTTSKEVFLTLGTFPTPLQGGLCDILNQECLRSKEDVLLVLLGDADGNERTSGLLVSRTVIGDDVQFHLAKAH